MSAFAQATAHGILCNQLTTNSTVHIKQDAVGNGRFCPGAATWRTRRNVRVVFDSGLFAFYVKTWRRPQSQTHTCIALQCHQRRTEPWTYGTCAENLVKFVHVVFEICEQTERQTGRDKQTDVLIAIIAHLAYRQQSNNLYSAC